MTSKKYDRKVLERFMSQRELDVLDRRYDENKFSSIYRRQYTPTQEHISMYVDWLKDKLTVNQAAVLMGVTKSTVGMRFSLIAKMQSTANQSVR